ncbi:response regulator [Rhizobium herbae]
MTAGPFRRGSRFRLSTDLTSLGRRPDPHLREIVIAAILILEDEPFIAIDVEESFLAAGYSGVVVVSTCADALDWLENHVPSAAVIDISIVADIQMPGDMDGIALAKYVGERWPHICIVVASGAVKPAGDDLPETAVSQ